MKIICWNVHYDVNDKKYTHIMENECDILILLEVTYKSYEFLKSNWDYSVWYNDTLYESKSDYGVAIFSKKYKLDFTENFNRNFRYVIPLKVFAENEFLFYLFSVWTKPIPINYSVNVIKALECLEYKEYVSDKALFIGDFNTPTKEDKRKEYDELISKGLIDCAKTEDVNYFTADYCFATEKMKVSFKISENIGEFDDCIKGKDKYHGLSDHCPIFVEIEKK